VVQPGYEKQNDQRITIMPSKSPKQKRFMAAAAHNPGFAKRAGIKQSVAKEFNKADQTHARLRSAQRKAKR
jgi:hypothetical protein